MRLLFAASVACSTHNVHQTMVAESLDRYRQFAQLDK